MRKYQEENAVTLFREKLAEVGLARIVFTDGQKNNADGRENNAREQRQIDSLHEDLSTPREGSPVSSMIGLMLFGK
jgi:hypothetical protein